MQASYLKAKRGGDPPPWWTAASYAGLGVLLLVVVWNVLVPNGPTTPVPPGGTAQPALTADPDSTAEPSVTDPAGEPDASTTLVPAVTAGDPDVAGPVDAVTMAELALAGQLDSRAAAQVDVAADARDPYYPAISAENVTVTGLKVRAVADDSITFEAVLTSARGPEGVSSVTVSDAGGSWQYIGY